MPRLYCSVHGTPLCMDHNNRYLSCTVQDCDCVSLDGKTTTSRVEINFKRSIDDAIRERILKAHKANVEGQRAVSRLADLLGGKGLAYGPIYSVESLTNVARKVAFLRQTDTLFDFPEASLGCAFFPHDGIGSIEVNHLRAVHARGAQLNDPEASNPQWSNPTERVVRIASKTHRKVFRWGGPLLESTVGIGGWFTGERLMEMSPMSFYDWCKWHDHWWSKTNTPEDPMWDCEPDKEWRQKDLFIVPSNPPQPLVIKAMGAAALVVDEYCWFLSEPLACAEKHKTHAEAVVHANKWLFANGILAGYKPKPKEQSYVTLLRNFLGGKGSRKIQTKSLPAVPKARRIEF